MATSCHRLDVEGPILSEYSKSPLPQLNSLESLLEGDIRQLNVVVVGRYRNTDFAVLSLCCCFAVAVLSLCFRYAFAMLSLCFRYAFAMLSLSLCCCCAVQSQLLK